MNLAEAIHQEALSCGFDNCGIIAIESITGMKEMHFQTLKR